MHWRKLMKVPGNLKLWAISQIPDEYEVDSQQYLDHLSQSILDKISSYGLIGHIERKIDDGELTLPEGITKSQIVNKDKSSTAAIECHDQWLQQMLDIKVSQDPDLQ